MHTPGKLLLKLASILFICWGCIALGLVLLFCLASSLLVWIISFLSLSVASVAGTAFLIICILLLLSSILQIITGILGLRRCGDPARASFFITNGWILCATTGISLLISFQLLGLIGLCISTLFVIGGYRNKYAS